MWWEELPSCDFKTCEYYSCGNCRDEIKNQTCEYLAIKEELNFAVNLLAKMFVAKDFSCAEKSQFFKAVINDSKRLYGNEKERKEHAVLVADALHQKVKAELKETERTTKRKESKLRQYSTDAG